jgi:hypothetical protein
VARTNSGHGGLHLTDGLAGGGRIGGLLGHVGPGSGERDGILLDWDTAEAGAVAGIFALVDEEPALTLLSGTGGTTETVDVGLSVTRDANLDDVRNVGEIHTAGSHVRGE